MIDKFLLLTLAVICIALRSNAQITDTFNDSRDGETYKTVKIGTQIWMAENLKATKYNDGSSIPNVTDASTWHSLTTPAYCNIDNTQDANIINTYGRLYNWYAVNTAKLCPIGWHVASDAEWTLLEHYVGLPAGGKLKETGTAHWKAPNAGATDQVGFKAVPSGYRGDGKRLDLIGVFDRFTHRASFWTSTEFSSALAKKRTLHSDVDGTHPGEDLKTYGMSVRCIKDQVK